MLVGEIIAGNARRSPNVVGWRFGDRAWTWREIESRVNRRANALLEMGLAPGDRVAVFSENSHHLAEIYFAFAKAGLIVVPINPRSVRREIDYILADVGARGLLVSRQLLPKLGGPADLSERVGVFLGIEQETDLADTLEARAEAAADAAPNISLGEDSIRAIKYTSGTTGSPKGCISTQRQFMGTLLNYLIQMPFTPADRCLLALPMAAGVGIQLLTTYAYINAETVIHERFDAGRFLDAIESQRITRFYAMPTMLAALAEEQEKRARDLGSLHFAGYGGQASPVAVIQRAMAALGCPFYQTFGASETGGFVAYLMPEDHEQLRQGRLGQVDGLGRMIVPCGREVQGFHLRVVDPQRAEVPPGDVGEVAVRSESNMSGYWNRPEQTAEVLADGWLYTGDMARREADGLIYIVDRKRDMIITGGYNVYSAEVEAVINLHPGVLEVAVVGVPDPYWGERVQAYVVRRANAEVSEDDLARFAAERLANYKCPKRFAFLPELPRTNSGKIRKVDLRTIA